MSLVFVARFPGPCAHCGHNVQGAECSYTLAEEVVHVECPPDADALALVHPRCGRCFCHHPGDC